MDAVVDGERSLRAFEEGGFIEVETAEAKEDDIQIDKTRSWRAPKGRENTTMSPWAQKLGHRVCTLVHIETSQPVLGPPYRLSLSPVHVS